MVAVLTWGAVAAVSLVDLSKAEVGQGVFVLAAGLLVIYAMALLAGLLMWVPGGLIYIAAGLALAGLWLKRTESVAV